MRKSIVLVSMLVIVSVPCFLAGDEILTNEQRSLKSVDDCVNFCRQVGILVHKGKLDAAFELLHCRESRIRPYIPMDHKNVLLTNFTAVIELIAGELGLPLQGGFEFIEVRSVGKSTINVYFWSKYQYGPVPWRITFYKPKDEWKFADFNFGGDLVPEVFLLSKPVDIK